MSELLAHLFGDYVLQNHAMAIRKTSSSFWAAVHVAFYTVPFLFITSSPIALSIIAGTHFIIDRLGLAGYWVRFWGVGNPGTLPCVLSGNFGCNLPDPAPPFLAVWLTIIVDNTFHLTINHLALTF